MRAGLTRYSPWQLRDYVFERGLPSLVVTGLVLTGVAAQFRALRSIAASGIEALAIQALAGVAPVFAFFLVLLSVNGIISNDRKSGTYRLLFARPVSIARFYAQAFVVHWVGAMLVTGVMLLAFAVLIRPVPAAGLFAYVTLYYVALGGVGFFFSSVMRLDWTLTAGLFAIAEMSRAIWPPEVGWYGRALHVVLPPLHRLDDVGGALVTGGQPPMMLVAWLLAYGAAAFVLGLAVLERRPMAE